MASEQQGERDLVALYASRMHNRKQPSIAGPGRSRPAPAVHQFGRRPSARGRRSIVPRGVTVSALVATAMVVGTQAASAAASHQIQSGDTLSELAEQYQTSVDHLAQLNGISDPDFILAGDTLQIEPESSDAPFASADENDTVPPPGTSYQVIAGQTLGQIADQHGVLVDVLAQANGIENPDLIEAGQILTIPPLSPASTDRATNSPAAGQPALHFVVPGETLGEIATQYGSTVQSLSGANSIVDPNRVEAGQLLRIPGATPEQQNGAAMLRGMPMVRQSLPLSCESAALSMATAYWGNQISEWVFIENMPYHPNPHRGFRGDMSGPFGGTTDYGVYAGPLSSMLSRYGFTGEAFYANGNADLLKQQIDQGRPVVVWMTNMGSVQPKSYDWVDGERFALVPQQHVVVVHGYDDNKVYVADPGDGAYRDFSWDVFMRSWGYFDGMSLAVYPQ